MACNPHFDRPVTERQVSASPVRKVVEIKAPAPSGERKA